MPLYDANGILIRPERKTPGGYKKVGRKHYREINVQTGVIRELRFEEDGTLHVSYKQDNAPLVQFGKEVVSRFKRFAKAPFQQQCLIPGIEYSRIKQRCGWTPGTDLNAFDEKKFDQIINDSNEAVIKTRPGKISCKRITWW